MPTLANALVQFLMSLFGNPRAAQAFLEDPEQALQDAGLGHVSSVDVDAAMPVVLDYAPITLYVTSFERAYNAAGTGGSNLPLVFGSHGGGPHDDHAHAVQQLHHVVNNYSYTATVEDRATLTDQSINQNIWAEGDVEQWFDTPSVVPPGNGAVAPADEAGAEDSFTTDNSTEFSQGRSIWAGSDAGVDLGETDTSTTFNGAESYHDAFNTDVDIDATLEGAGGTGISFDPDTALDSDTLGSASDSSDDPQTDSSNLDSDTTADEVEDVATTPDNIAAEPVPLGDDGIDDAEAGDVHAEFTAIEDSQDLGDVEFDVEPGTTTAPEHPDAG